MIKNNLLFSSAFAFIAMLPLTAMATPPTQNTAQNSGAVTVLGTVEGINNQREFTLRNSDSKFAVQMTTSQTLNLQPGEEVIVSGTVEQGLGQPIIKATTVRTKRDNGAVLEHALSNLPNSTTNLTAANKVRPQPAQQVGNTGIQTNTNDAIPLRNTAGKHVPNNSIADSYTVQDNRLTIIGGSVKNTTGRPNPILDNNVSNLVGNGQQPNPQ